MFKKSRMSKVRDENVHRSNSHIRYCLKSTTSIWRYPLGISALDMTWHLIELPLVRHCRTLTSVDRIVLFVARQRQINIADYRMS